MKIKSSKQFKNDFKLLAKQKKETEKFYLVVEKLKKGQKPEPKYDEHMLIGKYQGCMEIHIEPEWLLIYRLSQEKQTIIFYRTGSHSKLFK